MSGLPKYVGGDRSAFKADLSARLEEFYNQCHDEKGLFCEDQPAGATSRTGDAPSKIRAWARANGFDVGERGRIGPDVIAAYDKAATDEGRLKRRGRPPGPGKKAPDLSKNKLEWPEKSKEAAEIAEIAKKTGMSEDEIRRAHEILAEAKKTEEANNKKFGELSPNDADEVYSGVDFLGVSKRNDERQALRRELAVKAIPELAKYGDALILKDMSWDPAHPSSASAVAQHLADLAAIPDHLVAQFIGGGGKVLVGNGPITVIDDTLARLHDVQPRGWPAGTGYKDVAGVYNPNEGRVVLGNIASGRNTPVSNFAFHEFGHGLDAMTKKVSLLSVETRFSELHGEFKKAAKAAGYLNNYYVQPSTPGAGASEFFADATRAWMKAHVRAGNGFPEDRAAVVRNSFMEAGTFVSTEMAEKILAHFDNQYAVGGPKPVAEPKAPVRTRKPRSDAGKKRSTRDISFAEESRARSMKRSGATLAEISDALKISTGALSKLLGGI